VPGDLFAMDLIVGERPMVWGRDLPVFPVPPQMRGTDDTSNTWRAKVAEASGLGVVENDVAADAFVQWAVMPARWLRRRASLGSLTPSI